MHWVNWKIIGLTAKKQGLGLIGYCFDAPFWVCNEPAGATLIFSVNEEFVNSFHFANLATAAVKPGLPSDWQLKEGTILTALGKKVTSAL